MLSRPIKILHCLGSLNPGGVETWLLNVLRHIDRDQFQFDFCTFGNGVGLFASEAQQLGSQIHQCPRTPVSTLRGRFQNILSEGQYDVVHSHVHFFSGALLRWAYAEGVPIRIAHSHSSHDGKPNSLPRGAYRKLMKSWILRYATHGLAVSSAAAADLFSANWKDDRRIGLLHYGINLERFSISVNRDLCREQMNFRRNTPVVGHVGNFVAAKNHRYFLEVASAILKRRPEVQFLMIGDGPFRAGIESRVQANGLRKNMHFLGTRTDVPSVLLGCFDALLFPSLWEGLPLAVIEAQAAGLRCVVSSEIGEEVVVFAEQVTRLPLSSGPEEWATKVIEAVDRGRLDTEMCTKAVAKTDFCIERSVNSLIDLYSERVAGARAASN